jgi:hypothetical protein
LRNHGKNKGALTAGFAGNKGIETELPEGVKNRFHVTVRAGTENVEFRSREEFGALKHLGDNSDFLWTQ